MRFDIYKCCWIRFKVPAWVITTKLVIVNELANAGHMVSDKMQVTIVMKSFPFNGIVLLHLSLMVEKTSLWHLHRYCWFSRRITILIVSHLYVNISFLILSDLLYVSKGNGERRGGEYELFDEFCKGGCTRHV